MFRLILLSGALLFSLPALTSAATIGSSLSKGEDGTPVINRAVLDQLSGIPKIMTRAEFNAAIAQERANITNNNTGVWPAGEQISIYGEAGTRIWFVGSSAAASNANNVLYLGKTYALAADSNVFGVTTGAPSNGTGANGDYMVDGTAGILYGPKASGAWPAGQPLGGIPSSGTLTVGHCVQVGSVGGVTTLVDSGAACASSPSPVTLAVASQPASVQNFQRSSMTGGTSSKGVASVPLTISASAATTAACTVTDFTSAAAIESCGVISLASGSNTITVPVSARTGWDKITLTPSTGSAVSTTNQFGVGRIMAVGGQSEITRLFFVENGETNTNASLSQAISPYGSAYASAVALGAGTTSHPTAAWGLPSDTVGPYGSVGVSRLLAECVADSGVNCSAVGYGYDGSASATWQAGQSNGVTLAANLAATGNAWEAFAWINGNADAQAGLTSAQEQASLSSLFATLTSLNTHSGYTKTVTPQQAINNAAIGTNAQIYPIRAGHIAWAAANGATYVPMSDVDLVPVGAPSGAGLEISQAGYLHVADHLERAFRPGLGLAASTSDAGPTMTGASVSGSVISIAVSPANGTALNCVGSWWTRYAVYPQGTTTSPYTINSGTCSPTVITLTQSTTVSAPEDVWFDANPAGTNTPSATTVYDNNNPDALLFGRPLMPQGVPLTVTPAGTPSSLTVTTPTNATAGTPLVLSGGYLGSGYTPTGFSYQENGTGAFTALTSFSIPSPGSWQGTGPTYGAAATGQTLTIEDTATPSINATTGSFAVAAAGSATAITLTSPTYGPTNQTNFGNGLNGGYGTLPASAVATGATRTYGIRFNLASGTTPAASEALFGQAPFNWLGVSTAGQITGGIGSSVITTTTAINDGVNHYLEMDINDSASPTICNVFLDGALVYTKTAYTAPTITSQIMGVREYSNTAGNTVFAGNVWEFAAYSTVQHTAAFTQRTTPLTGSETGLISFWSLNSTGAGTF